MFDRFVGLAESVEVSVLEEVIIVVRALEFSLVLEQSSLLANASAELAIDFSAI